MSMYRFSTLCESVFRSSSKVDVSEEKVQQHVDAVAARRIRDIVAEMSAPLGRIMSTLIAMQDDKTDDSPMLRKLVELEENAQHMENYLKILSTQTNK